MVRALALALVVFGCAPDVAEQHAPLGEPMDGFPSWEERVIHQWTNRARADPAADLASCTQCAESACYSPVPPLVWSHPLARAARFHSDNLARAGCRLQHDSPCTLVSDLGTRYTPGSCNGSASCACAGGAAVCGSEGTAFGARVGLFGGSARAENIASGSDPVSTFYLWLHERDTSTACGWRVANGHRANILGDSRQIGVGKTTAGGVWTQDFGTGGTPDGIVSGAHYPQTGSPIAFRASWYRAAAPASAVVNVGGTCHTMTLERGTGTNGTFLANVSGISGCVRYFFDFDGVTYPSTGSYGIGCTNDWEATRPSACGCTPACGGNVCGDDGCGGSCGTCGAGRTCAAGACACASGTTDCGGTCVDTRTSAAHCGGCNNTCAGTCSGGTCMTACTPSCGSSVCGDDGCGGSCGTCGAGRSCMAGACACASGRTDCGGSCIDTTSDPSHCGGCGNTCAPGEACSGGTCACTPSCAGRTCGGDGCGGSCGTCSADRVCSSGACACTGALDDCGGACVDVRIDAANCGACGNTCASGEVCTGGVCGAAADAGCAPACGGRACGDDTCGGSCGECGALACGLGGRCLCTDDAAMCEGACVDLRASDQHCGECGHTCASDQRCVAGVCSGGAPQVDAGVGAEPRALRGWVDWGCSAAPRGTPIENVWPAIALLLLRRGRRARRRR
jgi:uncharacterized protein YkwD